MGGQQVGGQHNGEVVRWQRAKGENGGFEDSGRQGPPHCPTLWAPSPSPRTNAASAAFTAALRSSLVNTAAPWATAASARQASTTTRLPNILRVKVQRTPRPQHTPCALAPSKEGLLCGILTASFLLYTTRD
jgi:hypothetical protein